MDRVFVFSAYSSWIAQLIFVAALVLAAYYGQKEETLRPSMKFAVQAAVLCLTTVAIVRYLQSTDGSDNLTVVAGILALLALIGALATAYLFGTAETVLGASCAFLGTLLFTTAAYLLFSFA